MQKYFVNTVLALLACLFALSHSVPDSNANEVETGANETKEAALSVEFVPMSAQEIDAVKKQLSAARAVTGNFALSRHLKGMKKPLTSSGRFAFWINRGIYWETQAPFFSASTYTENDFIQWDRNLQPLNDSSQGNRAQKYVNDVILSLFQANDDALKRFFSVRWLRNGNQWRLHLLPSRAAVEQIIGSIVLGGSEHIQTVEIVSAQGEITDIDFKNHLRTEAPPLDICQRFYRHYEDQCSN